MVSLGKIGEFLSSLVCSGGKNGRDSEEDVNSSLSQSSTQQHTALNAGTQNTQHAEQIKNVPVVVRWNCFNCFNRGRKNVDDTENDERHDSNTSYSSPIASMSSSTFSHFAIGIGGGFSDQSQYKPGSNGDLTDNEHSMLENGAKTQAITDDAVYHF